VPVLTSRQRSSLRFCCDTRDGSTRSKIDIPFRWRRHCKRRRPRLRGAGGRNVTDRSRTHSSFGVRSLRDGHHTRARARSESDVPEIAQPMAVPW